MKACPGARYNITNVVESICENRIQKKKHGSVRYFLIEQNQYKTKQLIESMFNERRNCRFVRCTKYKRYQR